MPERSAISELRGLADQLAIPAGCELLAFGSSVHGGDPNDLDVLVVWEPSSRAAARGLRDELERRAELGLVHVTMLTVAEEARVSFGKEVGAVHIGGAVLVATWAPTE